MSRFPWFARADAGLVAVALGCVGVGLVWTAFASPSSAPPTARRPHRQWSGHISRATAFTARGQFAHRARRCRPRPALAKQVT